jgi:2,5-dioxopentanoate dehydrogenase
VVLLPAALKARAEALAAGFAASLTQGVGQFCTNPGLVFALGGADLDRFVAAAAEAISKVAPGRMLSPSICTNYGAGVARLRSHPRISQIVGVTGDADLAGAALFQVSAGDFLAHRALEEEVFGPSSIVVRCRDLAELAAALSGLEGQLTATLHMDAQDRTGAALLLPILEKKVGRVLANGWPTGVEVSPAMVHGGPFPATSDTRTTSVGTLAIERFLRPVCYQDIPDVLLAPELADANPLGLRRMIDGKFVSP